MGNLRGPLFQLTTGNYNIAIGSALTSGTGSGAGSNYTSSESSNICLGTATQGTTGESNTMRLGTTGSGAGQVNRCFLAGTYNVTPAGGSIEVMVMDSNGQTGTVTNNIVSTFNTDSGSASPSSGSLTIAGGTNANTSGSGSTVTVNVDTSMSGIVEIEGQTGQFTLKTFDDDSSTLVIEGRNDGGGVGVEFIKITNDIATPTCDLDDTVTKAGGYIYRAGGTDVPVTDGGTGVSSLTNHGVLIGSGTSAVSVTGTGTSPQVLTSNGASADPTFQDLPGRTAFKAYLGTGDPNATGNGNIHTLGNDGNALTELYDYGSNFNPTTGTFTVPADGIYFFNMATIVVGNSTATNCKLSIVSSTGEEINNNFYRSASSSNFGQNASGPIELSQNDTVTFTVRVSGETGDTSDIVGTGTYNTWVSGYRIR